MTQSRSLMTRAESVLQDVFGFSAFRSGQSDIVSAVLAGRDVVGVLPTGGGKSLCYQVPALLFPHLTLVVSPLIALMKDQTERLQSRGIEAYALHTGVSQGEINDVVYRASQGQIKLLYVAPERLESRTFLRLIQSIPMSLLAVDEAHCVSEWGHDFRPSYRNICALFDTRQRVPIVALTATATPDVRADIATALKLSNPVEIVRGFYRSNLRFAVENTSAKVEYVTQHVRSLDAEPTIVYCGSRRRVDTMADELRKRGIHAMGYHGGLRTDQRSGIQDAFLQGACNVLLATNAFGMGIDKPNVRHVIHTDLTLTLEAYYQEAGRAGRDGDSATCTLLFHPHDRSLMDFYIRTSFPEQREIESVYDYLCDRSGVSIGEHSSVPIMADEASIASALHTPEATIRGVISILTRNGVLVTTSAQGTTRVTLRTTSERLEEFVGQAPTEWKRALEHLSRYLLGRHIGEEVDIPVSELLRRTDLTTEQIARSLQALQLASIIRYQLPKHGGGIVLLAERVKAESLPVEYGAIAERKARAVQKLDVMVGYAETRQCKSRYILSYFGDNEDTSVCGQCSSCTSTLRTTAVSDRTMECVHAIVAAAWQVRGRFGRHVLADIVRGVYSDKIRQYSLDRSIVYAVLRERARIEILEAIDVALDNGWLVKTADLYPTIGVTEEGARLLKKTLRQLDVFGQQKTSVQQSPDGLLDHLIALRERSADRQGVHAEALCTLSELEAIAIDRPVALKSFVPGRHGSAMFIAQYAGEIIDCIASVTKRDHKPPANHIDEQLTLVLGVLRSNWTLHRLSNEARMSMAAAAATLQKGIESGVAIERGALVDDHLYLRVCDYIRYNRFAKLRDVRSNIEGDVELPVLRLAVAFARRDLFTMDGANL